MGTMPFHLEKGVLGLRMDYLCRSPAVRDHVVARLQAGEDPFEVAASISIPGVPVINVFMDRKADFVTGLDSLKEADPTPDSPYERRSGREYWDDQQHLMRANNDSTGNRDNFSAYWLQRRALVAGVMREKLIQALTSTKHHIDFWWECSLEEGEDPTVYVMETPGAAHVLFVTDHTPVEPSSTDTRLPLDDDPPFAS